MNVLSLFAGIGGLELGLERAGMTVVGQVEIDPFCRQVLAKHWPDVPKHDDVRTAVQWWESEPRPDVDLVCGGFPCQDISSANVHGRHGLQGAKSGLWESYRAVIARLRPEWVIIENSPMWRGWVPEVRRQMAEDGYESVALVLSAGSFGAPHRRPRAVVVANSHGDRQSLHAPYAQVAELRPLPRRSNYPPLSRAVGVGDGIPNRMDRLTALGNAVVPQVSEYIGRQLLQAIEAAA